MTKPRCISKANHDRFMARVDASGFVYQNSKSGEPMMSTPQRFMADCIGLLIQARGNPFVVARVTGAEPQAGRLKLQRAGSHDNQSYYIDVDDLEYWEPHLP